MVYLQRQVLATRKEKPANGDLLNRFILTGAPRNDLTLFIVKQIAYLVDAEEGRIGISYGPEGRRYNRGSRTLKMVEERKAPQLDWLRVEDIEGWIERAHTTDGPSKRWLFTKGKPNVQTSISP